MCRCFSLPISKCVIYLLSVLVAVISFGVIALSIVYNYSDTKEMIYEESEMLGNYIFITVLCLGLAIFFVACCGCLTARYNNKCFILSFAMISMFFMGFLFVLGGIVWEMNRYMIEIIEDDNGEADAGILKMIPKFEDFDFKLSREDRERLKEINRYMCSSVCPCPEEYKDLYQGIDYEKSVFLNKNTVQNFYPDCTERLQTLSDTFSDLDSQFVKIINILEKVFDCSGIDDKIFYFMTLDVSTGPPSETCGDLVTDNA
jgi:hypothetical protein